MFDSPISKSQSPLSSSSVHSVSSPTEMSSPTSVSIKTTQVFSSCFGLVSRKLLPSKIAILLWISSVVVIIER